MQLHPSLFLCGAPYPSNPCSARPAPAPCWHRAALQDWVGWLLPCHVHCERSPNTVTSTTATTSPRHRLTAEFGQLQYRLLLQLIQWFDFKIKSMWSHVNRALLLGHSLEIDTTLVLCDGCHLLFYLMHKSHGVSVLGNEVCRGIQQSLKVSRTTVRAFAGIDLPLVFGLRSVSILIWNV